MAKKILGAVGGINGLVGSLLGGKNREMKNLFSPYSTTDLAEERRITRNQSISRQIGNYEWRETGKRIEKSRGL